MTSNTQTSATVTWTLPYNGGALVTSFVVQIRQSNGNWNEEPTYCNARNDETVIANRLCAIPISALTQAPFLLKQGDIVVARVAATNLIGTSDYSSLSNTYPNNALIQGVPSKPLVGPSRGNLTTTN